MTWLQFDAVAEIKSNRTVDCLHDSVLIPANEKLKPHG